MRRARCRGPRGYTWRVMPSGILVPAPVRSKPYAKVAGPTDG